jgi:hypothetical protein
VGGTFHANLLGLQKGTPVSSAVPGLDRPTGEDGWFVLGQGWYVVTSAIFGTDEDPGVLGFVWVRWDAVVDLVLRHDRLPGVDHRTSEHPEPDAGLVGFAPLRFTAAVIHEKTRGRRPMHTASYRFPEGTFSHSELTTARRTYYFEAVNPDEGDDRVVGVLFKLS